MRMIHLGSGSRRATITQHNELVALQYHATKERITHSLWMEKQIFTTIMDNRFISFYAGQRHTKKKHIVLLLFFLCLLDLWDVFLVVKLMRTKNCYIRVYSFFELRCEGNEIYSMRASIRKKKSFDCFHTLSIHSYTRTLFCIYKSA